VDDFPPLTFKIGSGETKIDRIWLQKKREYFEAMWARNGSKIIGKIEAVCGDVFTNISKRDGINVVLHKKTPKDRYGKLNDNDPLEISLFIAKSDTANNQKERLIRMLVHSFIQQKYEFHFRMHDQTLFEDILADEYLTSIVSLAVMGKKPGRTSCEKALDEALSETIFRLSQKPVRTRLINILRNLSQTPQNVKTSNRKCKNSPQKPHTDILEKREELITELLQFLPKNLHD